MGSGWPTGLSGRPGAVIIEQAVLPGGGSSFSAEGCQSAGRSQKPVSSAPSANHFADRQPDVPFCVGLNVQIGEGPCLELDCGLVRSRRPPCPGARAGTRGCRAQPPEVTTCRIPAVVWQSHRRTWSNRDVVDHPPTPVAWSPGVSSLSSPLASQGKQVDADGAHQRLGEDGSLIKGFRLSQRGGGDRGGPALEARSQVSLSVRVIRPPCPRSFD